MEVEGDGEGQKLNPNSVLDGGEGKGGGGGNDLKEGGFLLGSPTFEDLGNGRLRCVETGHELPSKEVESYGRSKGCRLALIDAALSQKKPPLNMFKPDPLSKSKLICNLTGDTINRSEEHIWKHITGKRFLNKLQQKEVEKLESVKSEKNVKRAGNISNSSITSIKKERKKDFGRDNSMANKPVTNNSALDEPDFWTPPVGSRWDFDNGKDRWDSCSSSGLETDDAISKDREDEEDDAESGDLSVRTKRMSIAVGPSSFASRKKKSKNAASDSNGD